MRKEKKNVSYWIVENTYEKTVHTQIDNINQIKTMNITCEYSQVIISNYELKKTKEINQQKIEEMKKIFSEK
jgi:hypothetical protein